MCFNSALLFTDLGYREMKHVQVGRFIGQHHVENETSCKVADIQRPDGHRCKYSFPRHRIMLLTFQKSTHCVYPCNNSLTKYWHILFIYYLWLPSVFLPSVLWCCWLGGRKGIWHVKTAWWGSDMVICLEQGANGPADATATHHLLLH